MLKIVHQRFDKLLVDLTSEKVSFFANLALRRRRKIPLGVAYYNRLLSSSDGSELPALQLWLSVDVPNLEERLEPVFTIIQETNQIFPGTVQVLILNLEKVTSSILVNKTTDSARKYNANDKNSSSWKVAVEHHFNYQSSPEIVAGLFQQADIAVLNMLLDDQGFVTTNVETEVDSLTLKFNNFKNQIGSKNNLSIPLILRTSWPDTNNFGNASYFNLVQYWKKISKWAESTNSYVILDGAFDSPCKKEVSEQTTGWWRLVPGSSYRNSSDYIFEEKLTLIRDENNGTFTNPRTNLSLIHFKEDIKFSRKHVVPRLNPFELKAADLRQYNYNSSSLSAYVKLVSGRFGKVMIGLVHKATIKKYSLLSTAVAEWNQAQIKFNKTALEVLIVFAATTEPEGIQSFRFAKRIAETANTIHPATVKTLFLMQNYLSAETVENILSADNLTIGNLEVGVILEINKCFGPVDGHNFKENVATLLHAPVGIRTIGFQHDIDHRKIKLGVDRMKARVTTLFESCKSKIVKVAPNVQVSFLTKWSSNDDNEIQNYAQLVNYWEEISLWALRANTMIFFQDAFDTIDVDGGSTFSYGWWKLTRKYSNPQVANFYFEEKKSGKGQY